MTVNDAIMAADKLRPNAYAEEEKVGWLSNLDGKIALEVQHRKEAVSYSYPKDNDTVLQVSEPHSDIYPLYIVSMIDFYNKDTEEYFNSHQMSNAAYNVYAKWYIRNNMPPNSGGFKNYF